MELREHFLTVRDIPYSIPLFYGDEDRCCSGKHKILFERLTHEGYAVRWRVCTFKWSDMHLPEAITAVAHEDDSMHTYVEVAVNGRWTVVDATWDNALASILLVNEWDGRSDTHVAVPALETYSPEKSAEIVWNETQEVVESDLKVNGAFYAAINTYFESIRTQTNTIIRS